MNNLFKEGFKFALGAIAAYALSSITALVLLLAIFYFLSK